MYDYRVFITPSENGKTKYTLLIECRKCIGHNKLHTILKIGSYPHSDYIKSNGDNQKKQAYLARHKPREDWTINGVLTKSFWARFLLWNKKTLEESIRDIQQRFPQIKIELV